MLLLSHTQTACVYTRSVSAALDLHEVKNKISLLTTTTTMGMTLVTIGSR